MRSVFQAGFLVSHFLVSGQVLDISSQHMVEWMRDGWMNGLKKGRKDGRVGWWMDE